MIDRAADLPDPATEIRLTGLAAARGANYWSRRPVVRLDLAVGAYDELSSAEVPGVLERLHAALPGLVEHHCSIGERGGFLTRLRRGTYAPHIIEHVALELQGLIGHDVGYGRTRGGDAPGEYTVVIEHRHETVGLRAAALALDVVQRAFAGTLLDVEREVAELASVAATPGTPPVTQQVLAGITGGALRAETRDLLRDRLAERGAHADELIVDVSPGYLLQAGLPYARAELAVVLDAAPRDVPPRYQEPDRAERLMSVVADGVRRGGLVVAPASAWDVQEYARDVGCRVAVFAADGAPSRRDRTLASLVAWAEAGRLRREDAHGVTDAGPLRDDVPVAAQLAALLAADGLPDAAAGAMADAPPDAASPEPAGAAS